MSVLLATIEYKKIISEGKHFISHCRKCILYFPSSSLRDFSVNYTFCAYMFPYLLAQAPGTSATLHNSYPFARYLEKFPDYRRKFISDREESNVEPSPNLFGRGTTITLVGLLLIYIPRSLLRSFKT